MKKKSLLLFLSLLVLCTLCVPLKSVQQEEVVDLDDYSDDEEFEWTDNDNAFLDDVAGEIEYIEKDKHKISLFNKAFIGAKVVWSFCILYPCLKVKNSYFDYIHPLVIYPFKNEKKGNSNDA
jgi:hypothetical protein